MKFNNFLLTAAMTILTFSVGAQAATFNVDTTTDSAALTACTAAANDCSLRGAVSAANAASGSTINVPAGTYILTVTGSAENANATGDLDISADMTIVGAGTATTTINGNATDRIFDLINIGGAASHVVSISNLTVRNGAPPSGTLEPGGGIALRAALNTSTGTTTLNLTDVVVTFNTANGANGGGIAILKNATGGNLLVNIDRSTISGNTSTGFNGGGIVNVTGQLTITNSTISANNAQGTVGGGGLNITGNTAAVSITNSTFSGNNASGGSGGAINLSTGTGTLTLLHVTAAGNSANTATGGVHNVSGTLNSINSIIANNSNGNVGGANGLNGTNTTNILADFAGLGAPADNGGPTLTRQIPTTVGAGFPKDAGTNVAAAGLTFDQRGSPYTRISFGTVDIGAYEVRDPTAASLFVAGRIISPAGFGVGNANVTLTGPNGEAFRARSNPLGYYRFDEGVPAGATYVISVESKLYQFSPRVVNITDDTPVDFSALTSK